MKFLKSVWLLLHIFTKIRIVVKKCRIGTIQAVLHCFEVKRITFLEAYWKVKFILASVPEIYQILFGKLPPSCTYKESEQVTQNPAVKFSWCECKNWSGPPVIPVSSVGILERAPDACHLLQHVSTSIDVCLLFRSLPVITTSADRYHNIRPRSWYLLDACQLPAFVLLLGKTFLHRFLSAARRSTWPSSVAS